ncbi:hypothetical protein ABIC02_003058 [Bradyrhizobium sp. RT5a]
MCDVTSPNAPTNAPQAMTDAYANAPTNAPTNDTDARRTRPPTPPKAFVASRAASGSALATRTQTRSRLRGPRVRMLRSRTITPRSPQSIITNSPTASLREVSTRGRGRRSPHCRHERVDIQPHGWRMIERESIPRLAARPVESFAAFGRDETAASSRTHQRAPQRGCQTGWTRRTATVDADTVQTRPAGPAPVAGFAGLCAHRPHDRKSRGGYLRRVMLQLPFTLGDTGGARSTIRYPWLSPLKSRIEGGGVENAPSRFNSCALPISRRLFPHLFAATCSNTRGHG